MDHAALEERARARQLEVAGAFHPGPGDGAPEGTGTLVLLAPRNPGFWPHVTSQPEFRDGLPDPLDRWSTRVVGALAREVGALPLFPFGGPPFAPFIAWAKATGRIHASPVTLLVHDRQGLMVSFRGALALAPRLDLPPPPLSPCLMCHAPCETACPVDALSEDGYDTAACRAHLDTPEGADCLSMGCRARRACPVSRTHGRDPAQSAFHMRSFHR